MNTEIYLENKYFPWNTTARDDFKCWLKGELYYNEKIMDGNDIITLFSFLKNDTDNTDLLNNILPCFNGSFSLVIETMGNILCVVDRVRSIPLFYAKTDTRFIISDDANNIRHLIDAPFIGKNGAEFLIMGYVTGSETLFEGIFQIQAGKYLNYSKYDSLVTEKFYHWFWHENYYKDSEEMLLQNLDEVFVHVFQRLITSTKTKGIQFVVPLSGGLDSRLIVAMLKRLGVNDVICFSYGRKGNQEARISKQVADALGYRWYFVEYTKKRWDEYYHSEEMFAFQEYAGNLVSVPHIQDFLAVKILKEDGIIPKNAIFLPGHGGMLFGGSTPQDIDQIPQDFDQFINHTIFHHCILCRWKEMGGEELEEYIKEKIRKSVGPIKIKNIESLSNTIDFFNFEERQAKFITNAVRTYEYLGFEWRVPLWDSELMDFFLGLEIKFRINKYLYYRYLDFLFNRHTPCLKRIPNNSSIKYSSHKLRTNITKIVTGSSFFKPIARKIIWPYQAIRTYFLNEYNWYSFMSIRDFIEFYTGVEDINRYISKRYLKDIALIEKPDNLLKDFR